MNFEAVTVISSFLRSQDEIFTLESFYRYLRSKGVRLSKTDAEDILQSSNLVFSLVHDEYITRAGVFTGRWFSFKPSKEEVDKGYFLLGHRCMPFINPETSPDSIIVMTNDKLLEASSQTFSMNLALDTFSLYGEGYIIPYIIGDKGNGTVHLKSIQYSLPTEINLTSWKLSDIKNIKDFEYGDRLLCRVVDWENSVIEVTKLKDRSEKFVVSSSAVQREEWYSYFEEGLLAGFDKHGPTESIEEQLALLFLENQKELCIKNCGSVEEFLGHTTKIGFEHYGVESRIWRKNEEIPFSGKWNSTMSSADLIFSDMALTFSPQVLDAYLENSIYESYKTGKPQSLEFLVSEIFPQIIKMGGAEQKEVLLNIEKRNDILKKNYNRFSDFSIAELRKRILDLFSQVNTLFCDIACSGLNVSLFPQQELVVLSQLYGHLVRLLDEVENIFTREQIPIDDISLSLDGMVETFEDIRGNLEFALNSNRYKGYGIVKKD